MTTRPGTAPVGRSHSDGAVLFGRYAYPPNELGYCGPDRASELLERVSEGAAGRALAQVARGFEGAWPYLELIGQCLGRDPLDRAVVEAYWVGGPALLRCGGRAFVDSLETRFRPRLSASEFARLADGVRAGGVPHHTFHVFAVYPWVGLLRGGAVEEPLTVLDRCRIRWGRVVALQDEVALVMSQHLTFAGGELSLGPATVETARVRAAGHALAPAVAEGDWVSLHWDWVCDRLGAVAVERLRAVTAHQLAVVNSCDVPAPSLVLA